MSPEPDALDERGMGLLAELGTRMHQVHSAHVEPEDEPCYDPECECCRAWTAALQTLRDHAKRHVQGELRLAPCNAECLICATVDWQGDTEVLKPPWDRR